MCSSNNINREHLPNVELEKPVLLAEISSGRYNVIDGNHKLEKAYIEGVETVSAYKLPPKTHSLFITKQKAYDAYIEYWNGKLCIERI